MIELQEGDINIELRHTLKMGMDTANYVPHAHSQRKIYLGTNQPQQNEKGLCMVIMNKVVTADSRFRFRAFQIVIKMFYAICLHY